MRIKFFYIGGNSCMHHWVRYGVFTLLAVLFFLQIGTRPLANPDEGRYAEIGREILQFQDWITPHLNGLPYFEKPPFAYACTALGQHIFGINLLGARFFNTFFVFLTCLSVYYFCSRFFGYKTGPIGAGLLGTSALVFGMSQVFTLDGTLYFFVTTALLCYAWGFLEMGSQKNSCRYFLIAYTCTAFAVLTKGLVGLVFPAIVGFPWLLWTGRWRDLRRAHIFKGLLLIFLINFPWHYVMAIKYKDFCQFYFWNEHFNRYLFPDHNRGKPFYFLPTSFFWGLFPWILFLPRAFKVSFEFATTRRIRDILTFGVWWSFSIVAFYTGSHSQLIPYILPAIPGCILILTYAFSSPQFLQKCRFEYIFWAVLFLVVLCVLPHMAARKAIKPIPTASFLGIEWLLGAGALASLFFFKRRPKLSFCYLIGITIIIYFLVPFFMPYFQRLNTSWISQVVLQTSPDAPKVYCAYDYFQDLPFYLKNVVGTLDYTPEEQRLGQRLQPSNRYISQTQLLQQWPSNERIFVVVRRNNASLFEKNMENYFFIRLAQDFQFNLYTNHL